MPQGEGLLRKSSALVISYGGSHVLKLTVQQCHTLIRYYPELRVIVRVSKHGVEARDSVNAAS